MSSPSSPSAVHEPKGDGVSVLQLLAKIKNKTLSPRALSIEQRRACVRHLLAEDFRPPQIAEILEVSDRTVSRDRKKIREDNALKSGTELAQQVAGELVWRADNDAAKLQKIARDSEVPPSAQIDAIKASFEIRDKAIARAQSLGCLPTATQRVSAELQHSLTDMPSREELNEQVCALMSVAEVAGDTALASQAEEIVGLLKLDALQESHGKDATPDTMQ